MTSWVGTSWKMTKTLAEARSYAEELAGRIDELPAGVQPFVLPPATALATVAGILEPTRVMVGAQNAHWADAGAFTGEISAAMAADAGADLVELGHSERRTHFGETDATVRARARAVCGQNLVPLVCVGEDSDIRATGAAAPFVLAQALQALADITDDRAILVAYEPVWAIGENGRAATVDEVTPVLRDLRAGLARWPGVQLLYGGSVSITTAADYATIPEVDGLFVGRAAWTVDGLLGVANSYADARSGVLA